MTRRRLWQPVQVGFLVDNFSAQGWRPSDNEDDNDDDDDDDDDGQKQMELLARMGMINDIYVWHQTIQNHWNIDILFERTFFLASISVEF